MKDQILGLNISLLVHGIVVAALFILGQGKMFENKPIVIDLSILSSVISSVPANSGHSGHQKMSSTVWKENRNAFEPPVLPQKKVLKSTPTSSLKSTPKPVTQKQAVFQEIKLASQGKSCSKTPQTVPFKTMKEVIQASREPETTVRNNHDPEKTSPTQNDIPITVPGTYDTATYDTIKKSISGATTRLSEGGQGGGNPGNVGQAYVNMHFNYLRERIRKNLCYPKIARKMGWDGKVMVAFTILKNGHIDDLEIRKSCGIKILDRSAMETIRMACPFPKPPAVAKIVIPIVYNLN